MSIALGVRRTWWPHSMPSPSGPPLCTFLPRTVWLLVIKPCALWEPCEDTQESRLSLLSLTYQVGGKQGPHPLCRGLSHTLKEATDVGPQGSWVPTAGFLHSQPRPWTTVLGNALYSRILGSNILRKCIQPALPGQISVITGYSEL